jgi:predicted 3-demethylubiquinone-9 3-methyltransferase (glyoxalase superfamily)
MTDVTPCLWFADEEAETAVAFYCSLLPDSAVTAVTRSPVDTPGGKAGAVLTIEFRLAGRPYMALNGGGQAPRSHAVSFAVPCADQAEIDRLWDAFLAEGGSEVQCGWVTDRWGHSWQVFPRSMIEILKGDPDRAGRAMQAMFSMVKLDEATLLAAADGR